MTVITVGFLCEFRQRKNTVHPLDPVSHPGRFVFECAYLVFGRGGAAQIARRTLEVFTECAQVSQFFGHPIQKKGVIARRLSERTRIRSQPPIFAVSSLLDCSSQLVTVGWVMLAPGAQLAVVVSQLVAQEG